MILPTLQIDEALQNLTRKDDARREYVHEDDDGDRSGSDSDSDSDICEVLHALDGRTPTPTPTLILIPGRGRRRRCTTRRVL